MTEAHLRGYVFRGLCGAFLVHLNHPERKGRVIGHNAQKLAVWYEEKYWPERYKYHVDEKDLHSYQHMVHAQNEHRELNKQYVKAKPQYLDCQRDFGTNALPCREYLRKFLKLAIALAMSGGMSREIEPSQQMKMLQEAEVYSLPLQMSSDATKTESLELISTLYESMAIVASSGQTGDPSSSRDMVEMYIEKARSLNPGKESDILPQLLAKLEEALAEHVTGEAGDTSKGMSN